MALGRRAVSGELVMLGERIRRRRAELCLSQESLAEKVGISANTVSRIEGGQTAMTIGVFMRLVQVLDVDAGSLLGIRTTGQGNGKYRDLLYRISHLREGEQKIVLRTVEALVEAFRQSR